MRLAAEHELTYELLAWNAASINQQAPLAVEEKLLAAKRAQPAKKRRARSKRGASSKALAERKKQ